MMRRQFLARYFHRHHNRGYDATRNSLSSAIRPRGAELLIARARRMMEGFRTKREGRGGTRHNAAVGFSSKTSLDPTEDEGGERKGARPPLGIRSRGDNFHVSLGSADARPEKLPTLCTPKAPRHPSDVRASTGGRGRER